MVALRAFAGDGLFTAYSDEPSWQLAHDLLRPAFTKEAMMRYHPIMLAAASELFDSWDAREGPVDVSADMTKLTLETISRAAFSRDFGSFTRKDPHPFVPAMVASLRAGQRKGALDRDLLGIMLSTAHPDSGQRRNIRYQILTFLVAGHETTSGALSFALYYLSRNPGVLAHAQAESDAILGTDPGAEPTFKQRSPRPRR